MRAAIATGVSVAGRAATGMAFLTRKILASAGPLLRLAKMNVEASATTQRASQPARRRAWWNSSAPPVRPGLRSTTWPSRRCGAQAWATSWWAEEGTTTITIPAPSRASAGSAVTRRRAPKAWLPSSRSSSIPPRRRAPSMRAAVRL